MLELISLVVFMKSETKHHAVHAGLSVPLKHFQIDSVSNQVEELMSFFPQRTWLIVTTQIWDATVDG